jgi:hypothetical protein
MHRLTTGFESHARSAEQRSAVVVTKLARLLVRELGFSPAQRMRGIDHRDVTGTIPTAEKNTHGTRALSAKFFLGSMNEAFRLPDNFILNLPHGAAHMDNLKNARSPILDRHSIHESQSGPDQAIVGT